MPPYTLTPAQSIRLDEMYTTYRSFWSVSNVDRPVIALVEGTTAVVDFVEQVYYVRADGMVAEDDDSGRWFYTFEDVILYWVDRDDF